MDSLNVYAETIINSERKNDFTDILEFDKPEIIIFLYFNRNLIHDILYCFDKIITINYNNEKSTIIYNFYLSLLISNKPIFIDYDYSIDYIRKINYAKNIIYEDFKLVIFSKIINDLIDYYLWIQKNFINKETSEELEMIREENINQIKNLLEKKEISLYLNLKTINSNNIDMIYCKIIKKLIQNEGFKCYEYSYSIINILELENIELTDIMLENLFIFLNSNKLDKNKNIIMKKSDLNDEYKINFYYILLKFILKKSVYIYKISFLLQTKKLLLQIIKSYNLLSLVDNSNINNFHKEKTVYIILKLLDSKYYFLKYLNYLANIKSLRITNFFESNKIDWINYLKDENQKLILIKYLEKIKKKDKYINLEKGIKNQYIINTETTQLSERKNLPFFNILKNIDDYSYSIKKIIILIIIIRILVKIIIIVLLMIIIIIVLIGILKLLMIILLLTLKCLFRLF